MNAPIASSIGRPTFRAARNAALGVLLLAVVLPLGGCASTSFESPPGDALVACDPDWHGVWDIADEEESAGVLVVNDHCRSAFLDLDSQDSDPLGEQWLQLSFVEHEDQGYVVATDEKVSARNEQEAGRSSDSRETGAYTLARYDLAPGSIAVHMVDTRAAARMIVDGLLWGDVYRSKDTLRVVVRGTPEDTLRALSLPGLFEAEATFLLKRSARSIDEFKAAPPAVPPSDD
jgi:hypothetical protein